MKNNYFLIIFFILLSSLTCAYVTLFYYQLGSPVQAEWWIKDSYTYKDFLASSIKKPKILIVSGSNSLFGINSEILQNKTGYEVVNLASHASLDLDFFYIKIKQHISENDIVLMPLELNFYKRSDKISDWFSNNMMAWGSEEYLDKIGP